MKKFLLVIAVLLLACPVFGSTYAAKLDRVTDADMKVAVQRAGLTPADFGGRGMFTSGRVYYVDSATGDSASDGESWVKAMATLDQAINRAAARVANGTDLGKPVIYIREGHGENLIAADGFDADVAGITIKGLGRGSHKPTFTHTVAAGEGVVGAANVRLENLRFVTSVTGVISGIDIESTGSNAQIVGCDFIQDTGAETVDEFLTAVYVNLGADNVAIKNCWFNGGPAGAVQAIGVAPVSGCVMTDNFIMGDYSVGCIVGTLGIGTDEQRDELANEIIIMRNTLFNGTMDGDSKINNVAAITMIDGASGLIANNTIISNKTSVLMVACDDFVRIGNIVTDTDGNEFAGAPEYGNIPDEGNSLSATVPSVSPFTDS